MKEAADEFQIAVNAYVFMSNHLHLLLTPGEPSAISNAMHSASRRYGVRAGLVVDPSAYPWSSHRFYAMDEANSLVTPHPAITAMAQERSSLRIAYRALFSSPLEETQEMRT